MYALKKSSFFFLEWSLNRNGVCRMLRAHNTYNDFDLVSLSGNRFVWFFLFIIFPHCISFSVFHSQTHYQIEWPFFVVGSLLHFSSNNIYIIYAVYFRMEFIVDMRVVISLTNFFFHFILAFGLHRTVDQYPSLEEEKKSWWIWTVFFRLYI